MNRVTRRVWIMALFIAVLVGGTGFFVGEFMMKSDQWVISSGSPHVYNATNIGFGSVQDRNGIPLLDITEKRTYSPDLSIRKSTLHWLGDREGNISAPAISHYASQMSGFDYLNGIYAYGGVGGQATLTLSARVQSVALEAMGNRKGTIAVYNYKTGEILCAVTTPTFDPDNVPAISLNENGEYEGIYLNRFIQSSYIPGSIFKVVTTAAALDCIDDIQQQTFYCSGEVEFGVDRVTCEHAHGTVNLQSALARSCNCAFAEIALQVGPQRMTEYVQRFGVVDSLSFDGITTAKGNYDVSGSAPVELAWSCIGQYTDQINPCAFMTFMGAVGAGGEAAKPYLVERIAVGQEVTYTAQTTSMDRVLSPEIADLLRLYMRSGVETVYGAENFPGLTVCAKSGTSQVGGGAVSNAMFAGFVADENYPLAFIVVVENGGYGSSTCVPILSKVLAECKAVLDGK
ncbi:MAG: penicillin-binding transpeptidase domain-containing protein [Oscillospiraceae bacterium]|nr:penicillin-binding transpeptidase domain-containing protein [Oscillospiraceae bacterium]